MNFALKAYEFCRKACFKNPSASFSHHIFNRRELQMSTALTFALKPPIGIVERRAL